MKLSKNLSGFHTAISTITAHVNDMKLTLDISFISWLQLNGWGNVFDMTLQRDKIGA